MSDVKSGVSTESLGWSMANQYNEKGYIDADTGLCEYVGAMYLQNGENVLHIPSLRAATCPDETEDMCKEINGHIILYATAEGDFNAVIREYYKKMRSLRTKDTAKMDLLKRRVLDALEKYDKSMREYYDYVSVHADNRFLDADNPVLDYLKYNGYLEDIDVSLDSEVTDEITGIENEPVIMASEEKEYIPNPIAEVFENVIVPEYEEYELEDDDAPMSIPGLDAIMFTKGDKHYFKYRPYTETYQMAKDVYLHAQQVYDGELENERAAMSEVELQSYMEAAETAFDKATARYEKAKAGYDAYVEETGNDFMRAQHPVDAYMDYMSLEEDDDVNSAVPSAEFSVDDSDLNGGFLERLKEIEARKAKKQVRRKHFMDILSSEYLSAYDANAGQRRRRVVAKGYGADDLNALRESLGLSGDTKFQTFNGPDIVPKTAESVLSNKLMTDEQKAAALDAVSDSFNADSPVESNVS